MGNRICILRGTLYVRDPQSPAVINALREFSTHPDQLVTKWAWPHPEVAISANTLTLLMYVRGRVGYRSDSIAALVEAIGPLTDKGSSLGLHDVEFVGIEPQMYWVGADDTARNVAKAEYGLDLAREYLSPLIGYHEFANLSTNVLASVRLRSMASPASSATPEATV